MVVIIVTDHHIMLFQPGLLRRQSYTTALRVSVTTPVHNLESRSSSKPENYIVRYY